MWLANDKTFPPAGAPRASTPALRRALHAVLLAIAAGSPGAGCSAPRATAASSPEASPAAPSASDTSASDPASTSASTAASTLQLRATTPAATDGASSGCAGATSEYSVWLSVRGEIDLARGGEGTLVLVAAAPDGYTVAPGYVASSRGLREEPALLAGIAPWQAGDGYVAHEDAPAGTVLSGRVSIFGRWPDRAEASVRQVPEECDGCYEKYRWNQDRWALAKEQPLLPVWWDGASPEPTHLRFDNGVEYWERFDAESQKSVLYVDPRAKKRAMRQRAREASCSGGVRIRGQLSAVTFSDGGMLAIGLDCRNQRPAAEYWRKGALTSRILPLPGHPGMIIQRSPDVEPTIYLVRANDDVVIAFPSKRGGQEWLYVAAFDGQRWQAWWPPQAGGDFRVLRDSTGAVWLTGGLGGSFSHPGLGAGAGTWVEASSGLDGPADFVTSPRGAVWAITPRSVYERTGSRWQHHPLPGPVSASEGGCYFARSLSFAGEDSPLIIADVHGSAEQRRVLLGRGAPARVFER